MAAIRAFAAIPMNWKLNLQSGESMRAENPEAAFILRGNDFNGTESRDIAQGLCAYGLQFPRPHPILPEALLGCCQSSSVLYVCHCKPLFSPGRTRAVKETGSWSN